MLTYGVIAEILHENALLHTADCTVALLEHFNWELFDNCRYSPDLAPSDYHLFSIRRGGCDHSTSIIMSR
jgi:hypothetical protein